MLQLYPVPKAGCVTQFWPFLAWRILGNVFPFWKKEREMGGEFCLFVFCFFPPTTSFSLWCNCERIRCCCFVILTWQAWGSKIPQWDGPDERVETFWCDWITESLLQFWLMFLKESLQLQSCDQTVEGARVEAGKPVCRLLNNLEERWWWLKPGWESLNRIHDRPCSGGWKLGKHLHPR